VKTLRKILVLRETLKTKPLARLVYHTKVKGAVTEAKGEAAEAEVEAGAKAIKERKWYCIFHKENDDHTSNYCLDKKRFEVILEEENKEKERNNFVNHSAPTWQNPNFGRNPFASPFQPPHFQPPIPTYTQPTPWQSQVFQAQNVERRPVDHHPITPPPPPYKGPTAPPAPAKLEGQNDPLPSVRTILPISSGSAPEFDSKKDRKHYFREVRNICVDGEWKERDGLIFQSLSQKKM
jgi:hypothetical protein